MTLSRITTLPLLANRLGTLAKSLLRKLGAGQALIREADEFRCDTMYIARHVVDQLSAADLIMADGVRRLVISEPGKRWLERELAVRSKNTTAEGFDRQNRVMARVKLPDTTVYTDINLAESPLAWLARRKLITAAQFKAGEKLRADFHSAARAPKVTMSWDAPPMGKTARGPAEALDPTTAQLAARRRFEAAIAAAGPGLSDVLWRVACMGEGLETAEKAMQWPVRTAKVVLALALDRLVVFYKI